MNKIIYLRRAWTCLVLFAVIAAVDYFTGYELTSYPLYLMPIFLTFYYFGAKGGYLGCVVGIALWYWADVAGGHQLSNEAYRVWNGGSRLVIYAMFVYGLSVYHKTIEVHRRRLAAMQALIPMCHGCGNILWQDGNWKAPDEVLADRHQALPECPTCRDAVAGKAVDGEA